MEQGLGKYVDADFIHTTSHEMQEDMGMTSEEMDRAAHALLRLYEKSDVKEAYPVRPSCKTLSGAAARDGGLTCLSRWP